MKDYYKTVGLFTLCGLFGYTRQAWYEHLKRQQSRRFDESIVLDLVHRERQVATRVGCQISISNFERRNSFS